MNGYKVRVQCSGTDTFHTGATYYDIPTNKRSFITHMHSHGFHQISSLNLHAMFALGSAWDASNFSSSTKVPFDVEVNNSQAEMFVNSSGTLTVLTAGDYQFNSNLSIDSSGGSSWHCEGEIFVNGVVVPYSKVITSNYQNEDSSMQHFFHLDLEPGDEVELRVDQDSLTGSLIEGNFSLKLTI